MLKKQRDFCRACRDKGYVWLNLKFTYNHGDLGPELKACKCRLFRNNEQARNAYNFDQLEQRMHETMKK